MVLKRSKIQVQFFLQLSEDRTARTAGHRIFVFHLKELFIMSILAQKVMKAYSSLLKNNDLLEYCLYHLKKLIVDIYFPEVTISTAPLSL